MLWFDDGNLGGASDNESKVHEFWTQPNSRRSAVGEGARPDSRARIVQYSNRDQASLRSRTLTRPLSEILNSFLIVA